MFIGLKFSKAWPNKPNIRGPDNTVRAGSYEIQNRDGQVEEQYRIPFTTRNYLGLQYEINDVKREYEVGVTRVIVPIIHTRIT